MFQTDLFVHVNHFFTSVITNWGSLVIIKWGRGYYKLGQLLQIRASVITNWCNLYYKLGQLLQIGP